MYIVQGATSLRHSLNVAGQGEPNGQTYGHRSGRQFPPDRLLLSTDGTRLSNYAQNAGKR